MFESDSLNHGYYPLLVISMNGVETRLTKIKYSWQCVLVDSIDLPI